MQKRIKVHAMCVVPLIQKLEQNIEVHIMILQSYLCTICTNVQHCKYLLEESVFYQINEVMQISKCFFAHVSHKEIIHHYWVYCPNVLLRHAGH